MNRQRVYEFIRIRASESAGRGVGIKLKKLWPNFRPGSYFQKNSHPFPETIPASPETGLLRSAGRFLSESGNKPSPGACIFRKNNEALVRIQLPERRALACEIRIWPVGSDRDGRV
jgi:hypothetical protein